MQHINLGHKVTLTTTYVMMVGLGNEITQRLRQQQQYIDYDRMIQILVNLSLEKNGVFDYVGWFLA